MAQRLLFIILIAICSKVSLAQKLHIGNLANVWTYLSYTATEYDKFYDYHKIYYGSDTLINGAYFHRVLSDGNSFIEVSTKQPADTWTQRLLGYLREDTATGKVLYQVDGVTQLLYDTAAVVGDTVYDHGCRVKVEALNSITINGVSHKVWTFINDNMVMQSDTPRYYVIDGIGSLSSFFRLSNKHFCNSSWTYHYNSGDRLLCFSNNGNNIALPIEIGDFDNSSSCMLSVNDTKPVTSLQLRVVPNPATSNSVIEFPDPITGHIAIYDGTGRLITTRQLTHVTSYSLAGMLPCNGWYSYQLITADGKVAVGKFTYAN